MKILTIHADFIEFAAKKKALKEAEAAPKEPMRVEECLVVFTAVEKADEKNLSGTVERYVQEIQNVAQQVSAKNIVLYPYAHLSADLAKPQKAEQALKEAEALLVGKKFKVTRAPFGWYKSFTLSCKGHPLSELSRSFTVTGDGKKGPEPTKAKKESAAAEAEEKVDHEALLKKMGKIHMATERGKSGLKSNVELGRELDLYFVNEIVGSGLPLLTPKGAVIRRELERFIVDEEIKRGYQFTYTPFFAKSDLYKISGHWQHYKDNMFTFTVGEETFALRPMTCPFQFVIYKSRTHSYKELPIKLAEISTMFRNEKSGELMGLTRVRQFTLADAHVICRADQIEEEFRKVVDLIQYVKKTLQMEGLWYRFSKGDSKNKEKYIDNPAAWESTQKTMKRILDGLKLQYIEAENEAAFYGPKLDIQYENVFGKEDTLLTVQIDFALPERFDLSYIAEKNEKKRPFVIHRSSVGCLERTMAYLLEKTQGNLPLWLSPVQVKVITVTDRANAFAREVTATLQEQGLRVELDDNPETVGKKVREAQLLKANYIVTIGDKEVEKKKLAVRSRDGKVTFDVPMEKFVQGLLEEREMRAAS